MAAYNNNADKNFVNTVDLTVTLCSICAKLYSDTSLVVAKFSIW